MLLFTTQSHYQKIERNPYYLRKPTTQHQVARKGRSIPSKSEKLPMPVSISESTIEGIPTVALLCFALLLPVILLKRTNRNS